jgi:hypothetical protein
MQRAEPCAQPPRQACRQHARTAAARRRAGRAARVAARQGIMFWRWDAVNTVNLGEGDSALTIGINSNTFQARLIRTALVPRRPG